MRPPFPRQASPLRHAAGGFSLLELLAAIGIMMSLMALTVPATSFLGAAKFSRATVRTAEILETARQYAVSHNTYTWAAFYVSSDGDGPQTVYVALVASVDGTSDILSDPTATLNSSAVWPGGAAADPAKCQLVRKIDSLPETTWTDSGSIPLSSLPASPAPVGAANTSPTFSLTVPGLGAKDFTRSIEFTPTGEAKVQAAPVSSIEFGLRRVQGTVASNYQVAVMRINGFTGQTQVYQP